MSIIYDALKKVEQKISPANQKGTEPMPKTGKFPIKRLLLVAAVFVLGLFIAKYIFSTFLSTYIPNVSFLNYFQNEAFSGAKDIVGALSGHISIANLLSVSKAFVLNLSGGFV